MAALSFASHPASRMAAAHPRAAPSAAVSTPARRIPCAPTAALPAAACFQAARHSATIHSRRSCATAVPRRLSGRSSLRVRASWGAPVEWAAAKVVSNQVAAENLHTLVVDIGPERAAGFTTPGQYVQLKVGEGKPGFFAIASAPDPNNQGALELLIKAQGEAAEALVALAPGAQVDASPVMGKGFQVDTLSPEAAPQLLLFATGSGISPIKSLIESGALQAGQRRDVRLYYGTRDPGSTAYASLIPGWEAAGVKVVQVLSGSGGKYVQDVFEEAAELGPASEVGAVLCGHKGMVGKVKEVLAAAGVAPERMLLNF